MDTLIQDLRYSLRTLLKRPAFTGIALLALALGIGANTAIFSVINAVVLRPLPYEDPGRLVIVNETNPAQDFDRYGVSYPNYLEWRQQNRVFDHLSAIRYEGMTLTGTQEPARFLGGFVSADIFELLGVAPSDGRAFLQEEDVQGAVPVVVVSHGFWQRRMGGVADAVGQVITLNGIRRTIVGIMPQDFRFPELDTEVWMPLGPLAGSAQMQNRRVHFLTVIGRLKPGVTEQDARTDMETIAARIEQAYPGEDAGHRTTTSPLQAYLTEDEKPALFILFGAVALVLLIACANVANLLLARAAVRQKEMAIRSALGAGRARTIRQLLTESIMLSLAGGAVSILFALWSVDLLAVQLSEFVSRADEIRVDGMVLGFTVVIALITGVIFGLIPAIQISRPNLNHVLKDRTEGYAGRQHMRQALVVVEIALSLVLLVGAGLALRSFWQVLQEDPGFRSENLLMMTVSLPNTDYPGIPDVISFYQQLPEQLESLPGVTTVSAVNALPISGGDSNGGLTIEGRPFPPGEEPGASYRRILPNYFRAMGIPVIQGREFDERDAGRRQWSVIINESMARRYFQNSDPIGQRIKVGPPENEPWMTIVGVVGDVRNVGLDTAPLLATYEPHSQRVWRTMNVLIRTAVEPTGMITTLRRELRNTAPGIIIENVTTMEQHISASVSPRRLNMLLLGLFAVIALVLAIIGIYGVMSYAVTQRTHEIGVRMAIGAKQVDVFKLIVGQAMFLAFIGVVLGGATAIGVTRLVSTMLYKVSPTDPITFLAITVVLLGVALLASYLPARRATKVDPMVALRYE